MSISDHVEERFCFVNCGLPGDQCACYRRMMHDLGVAGPSLGALSAWGSSSGEVDLHASSSRAGDGG